MSLNGSFPLISGLWYNTTDIDTMWKGIYKKTAHPHPHPHPHHILCLSPTWTWLGFHIFWNMNYFRTWGYRTCCFSSSFWCTEPGNNGAITNVFRVIMIFSKLLGGPWGLKPLVWEVTSFCKTCFLEYWTLQGLALISI